MFIKVAQAEWHETLSMTEENRGNFGSTGLQ
jgi:dUTPase